MIAMPSRTPSAMLHVTTTSAVYPVQLNCVSYMKPYTATYITDYISDHKAVQNLHNYDNSSISPSDNAYKPPKKRVSFADSVGLELVQIRHMTAGRDTPPNLSPDLLSTLNISKKKSPVPSLQLDFLQPVSDYSNFRQSLEQNYVALESVSVNDNIIIGTVKVKNLAFQKAVFVHVTYDEWVSSHNVTAYYVNNGLLNAQGNRISSSIDTFSFTLEIPATEITHHGIQFAVCFSCEGQEFWDNNGNRNYRIKIKDERYPAVHNSISSNHLEEESNWTEYAIWRGQEFDYTPYW